ncbi:MAG: MBL fold metallo-hydrolase [Crocinitomicaceae bacterium]|nr:MBL fold metallo-hydrolase [Crocinitomicaceae bacterium]
MKLHVHAFTFNPFQENTYVIFADNGDAVIIDPGCYDKEEENELDEFIEANQLNVLALLNTHAHIDHVLGNSHVIEKYKVDYYLHEEDLPTLNAVSSYAHVYGFPNYKISPQPTKLLNHGDTLVFKSIQLEVFFTPGHAPGHVVFYNKENNLVINGDVLFQDSFGRVDLPGGDLETLKKSIFDTMFQFPENTVVYCGHGPATTIGREKTSNYILNF